MVLAQTVDITTMPTFLPPVPSKKERQQDHLPLGDYFREWQSKGEDFKAALPFKDYCQLRQDKSKWNNGGSRTQSSELQRTIGRTPLPMYERSTSPCESKPKKTGTVKKMNLFSSIFSSRGNESTFEEVKKIEEEEVPCTSYSHQEEDIEHGRYLDHQILSKYLVEYRS